jgi:lysine biosynthesis protein LysW
MRVRVPTREGSPDLETTTRLEIRTAHCPECQAEVRLVGRLLIGEVFGCTRCGAQLEVASSDPMILEPFARVDQEYEPVE